MAINAKWKFRKARVQRVCMGYTRAKGCGRVIQAGEKFAQHTHRDGLARAEVCIGCTAINGIA